MMVGYSNYAETNSKAFLLLFVIGYLHEIATNILAMGSFLGVK